ncbi:glycosyltransferase family 4 protein [Ruegeria conchae]|uniref:Glycosyltransferase involved in cell wall biosynthesis n=1 Tax=Ruegeria conchae TaxID=981384 RepID=A0A497ZL24_9RHOB|nr:glycosyltransferase family 4 protein [Ruegeria conchae]RLK07345.1 glycosyltransferase involved in cell wall biosynthesis [Ruegeria conchae]
MNERTDQPMKIAIYVSSWPPGRVASGIVTYTSQLVSSLRAFGHEVYILTPDAGEKDPYTIDLGDVQVPFLSRIWHKIQSKLTARPYDALRHSAKIALAIRKLVAEKGIEVFEIEESFGMGAEVAMMNIVPVSVRLHGPFVLTGGFKDATSAQSINDGRSTYEGLAIKAAHYVTANCNDTLDTIRKHYDLGIESSTIIPTPIVSSPETETWQVDRCDKNKMFFVGRFDSIKGGDLVLRTFARLAEANPDLTLTFIGPDQGIQTENGTVYFEEFFEQNFPPKLRDRVDYRGQMTHSELMSLRTSHYLTLIAAQYDTMGYMLLEPMSLGCPLVTTAVGGIPEVIEDERNGLLIPSQDLEAMVAACQRLLDDPDLATRLGRQAWADCSELYSPDAVATKTVEGYKAAIRAFKG